MFKNVLYAAACLLMSFCWIARSIDGHLDLNFNNMGTFPDGPGKADINFTGLGLLPPLVPSFDLAFSIAVDNDGNYILAGYSNAEDTTGLISPLLNFGDFAAVKLTPEGEPVTSFNNFKPGFGVYNFDDLLSVVGTVDQAFSVAVDPSNNHYLLVGRSNAQQSLVDIGLFNFAAVKLTPTGLPDPSFNNLGPGFGVYPFLDLLGVSTSIDEAFGGAVDQDGNYVLVGRSNVQPGGLLPIGVLLNNFAVVKTNSTGLPDPVFGGGGLLDSGYEVYSFGPVALGISTTVDEAYGVAVDSSDNSYIVAGLTTVAEDGDPLLPGLLNFGVLKLGSGGIPAPGFGGNGLLDPGFASYNFALGLLTSIDAGFSVAVDNDGNYVIAGLTTSSLTGGLLTDLSNIAVLKISSTGLPVSSFGNVKPGFGVYTFSGAGLLTTSIDQGFGITVDDDNKYVIAGISNAQPDGLIGQTGNLAVLRLLPDGTPDASFNPQGFPGSLPYGPGRALIPFNGSLDLLFLDELIGLITPGPGVTIAPADGAIVIDGAVFNVDVLNPSSVIDYNFGVAKLLDDGFPPAPAINPLGCIDN